MSLRLIFKNITATEKGFTCESVAVIDSESGETLRIAKITPELISFLEHIEIDVTNYFTFAKMCEKNPNLKKLTDTFKLYT